MNIRIKATNITLTPGITDYINTRMEKAAQLLGNNSTAQCDVEVGRSVGHQDKDESFRADIHIVSAGSDFYAKSEKQDLYVAIDDARDGIMGEIKGAKGKRMSAMRRGGARVKDMVKGIWPWNK